MIDLEKLLTPIEGENPAGENLRYTPTYDAIKEARREEDDLDRGEWDREVKTADWEAVRQIAIESLTEKTKDIQIAVWLIEALIKIEGFPGLESGLELLSGLMETFWDNVYPEIEDDDLDYRIGPLEFMNDKLWLAVKQVPLTDPEAVAGYAWIQWQEAVEVGTDESAMAEGKLGIEDFEKAASRSSKAFYADLNSQIEQCIVAFTRFDNMLDEKFGSEAPRTAEFKQALEDCQRFIAKQLKQKIELDPDPEPQDEADAHEGDAGTAETAAEAPVSGSSANVVKAASVQGQIVVGMISDIEPHEDAIWNSALTSLQNEGIKKALEILFAASCSVSSVRSRNRYRLLMAKLCLQANRTDLARPIAEELNTLLEELGLERWESPVWVADVLGALYRCLIQEEEGSDDHYRAEEIFKKMCTIDLTKALQHRR
ncbi:type VI secretion protein [Desulfosarcina alkanivorans]|uniref:Type VI secretion protein n=1 Tax=Desulfosarcina alkanivorans TaxID=571177 RepID=A0A5K7YGH4_9BACT|nr:type VI secretion system protein TssA [Desulfosarcina alkanivorans]BBO67200.1 type VI secretion protein [Desulfosarcina alkanivorans]